jgi:FMN phosphatase YigB (HAD superfamily)
MNDGTKTNEQAFWDEFAGIYGESARNDLPHFDAFYEENFVEVKAVCGFNPLAAQTVRTIKDMGFDVVLATNPIFPRTATRQRAEWAGLSVDEFVHVTTYENSRFCKPNPEYYRDVMRTLGVRPEDCLMVGNDVKEDVLAGQKAGMSVFLITDCVINKDNLSLLDIPSGTFDDLIEFIKN